MAEAGPLGVGLIAKVVRQAADHSSLGRRRGGATSTGGSSRLSSGCAGRRGIAVPVRSDLPLTHAADVPDPKVGRAEDWPAGCTRRRAPSMRCPHCPPIATARRERVDLDRDERIQLTGTPVCSR